jgi:hypothetical protein
MRTGDPMALTLTTAATLRKLRNKPDFLKPETRQVYTEAKEATSQLSQAIDAFLPNLDESKSDGASGQPGLVRYHTSKGERIQATFQGNSQKGEYVQEWVGGGFLYTSFDENTIDNYQVGPNGANHLHIDRRDESKSYVEISPKGFNLLNQEPAPESPPVVSPESMLKKDGIGYAVLSEGNPEELADIGESVLVHYTGWLENGESFDSSKNRPKPFQFQLGKGSVIQGWEKGVEGMKVGERRLLDIPAHLAYGERERGSIPANSPLLFEVELLATSGELKN